MSYKARDVSRHSYKLGIGLGIGFSGIAGGSSPPVFDRFFITNYTGRTARLRGGNLILKPTDEPWWYLFWGANYDLGGWIKPQIDALKGVGGNCLRIFGDVKGVLDGHYTRAQYISRVVEVVAYCQTLGLYAYVTFGDYNHIPSAWNVSTSPALMQSEMVALATALDGSTNMIGLDVWQESFNGYNWPSGVDSTVNGTLIAGWAAAIKGVTDIPLTASDYAKGGDPVQTLSQGAFPAWADFKDCHKYNYPITADEIATAIALLPSKALLCGEFGTPLSRGSSQQTIDYQGMRDASLGSYTPQFAGHLQWAISDQDTVAANQWGMFDASLTARSYMTDVFKTWPKVVPSTLAFASEVAADSPFRRYRLNESSGIAAIDSGSDGINGVYLPNSGGSWTGGTLGSASPVPGSSAASFDGTSGTASTGDLGIDGLAAFTFECLYYYAGPDDFISLWSKYTSESDGFEIVTGKTGTFGESLGLLVKFDQASQRIALTGSVMNNNAWNHIVVVFNGAGFDETAKLSIYVNGKFAALTYAGAGTIPATMPNITATASYIGSRNNAAQFAAGKKTEMAFYASALSPSRVLAHYAAITK